MKDLGLELDSWRLERVRLWYLDLHLKRASHVRRVGRSREGASQQSQVCRIDGLGVDARFVLVILDISQLLGNTALAGRHGSLFVRFRVALACVGTQGSRGLRLGNEVRGLVVGKATNTKRSWMWGKSEGRGKRRLPKAS
jgi:hypothetical protein